MTRHPQTRADRMAEALSQALSPYTLEIIDDSARHVGHAGASEEGQTHYHVTIGSDEFAGLSRVARHRLVNAALAQEFDTGLHALQINALAPGEER